MSRGLTRSIDVVIGANFGDEGKGLITDYLCDRALSTSSSSSASLSESSTIASQAESSSGSKAPSLVVRFNGGAQAGHTVQLPSPSNHRHVFSHYGSGSLIGADTFLSEYFIVNPAMALDEKARLLERGCSPKLYVHPKALLSTPYDIMINQCVEETRGESRHGSCGVGIGETVERQESEIYGLTVEQAMDHDYLLKQLHRIRSEWVPKRLAALNIDSVSAEVEELIASDEIWAYFAKQTNDCIRDAVLCDNAIIESHEHVVFEGAQGLLLDQDHAYFPYVTRSSTGIKNVISILQTLPIFDEIKQGLPLNTYYLTRSYITRHGAGPLPYEGELNPLYRFQDKTNRPHPFQGELRFAPLDIDALTKAIQLDLQHISSGIKPSIRLAITCLDQIGAGITVRHQGQSIVCSRTELLDKIQRAGDECFDVYLVSDGPTRAHVAPYIIEHKAK